MSKFCAKCGSELKDNAKFCRMCGFKVADVVPEEVPEENAVPVNDPVINTEEVQPSKDELKKAKKFTKKGKLFFAVSIFVIYIPIIYSLLVYINRYLTFYGISKLYKFFTPYFFVYYITKILFTPFLIFMVKKVCYGVGHKKNEDYYCPKCKKVTSHNKYKVCFDCGRDNLVKGTAVVLFICLWALSEFVHFPGYLDSFLWRDFYYYYDLTPTMELLMYIASQLIYIVLLFIASFVLIFFTNYIYMYPAIVARRNGHQMAAAIFWLNLLFGVTIIFWIVFLIWASSASHRQEKPAEPQQTVDIHNDIQSRFADLMKLKEQGFISEEEFERKREEILSKL